AARARRERLAALEQVRAQERDLAGALAESGGHLARLIALAFLAGCLKGPLADVHLAATLADELSPPEPPSPAPAWAPGPMPGLPPPDQGFAQGVRAPTGGSAVPQAG